MTGTAAVALPQLPLEQLSPKPQQAVPLKLKPTASTGSRAKLALLPAPRSRASPKQPIAPSTRHSFGTRPEPRDLILSSPDPPKQQRADAEQSAALDSSLLPMPDSQQVLTSSAAQQPQAVSLPSAQPDGSTGADGKAPGAVGDTPGSRGGALQALIDRAQKLQAAMDVVLTPDHRCANTSVDLAALLY